MAEFLNQCFLSFKVAFWGNKIAWYMEDVVPVVLGRLKGKDDCIPCFVWSAQECESVQLGDGATMEGGKPLDAVYRRWPYWNASNTVIVDHYFSRVACNPMSNIIAPNPFYMEHLQKLGEDKNYLKSTLWPMLQAFFDVDNVYDFCRQFPPSAPVSDNTKRAQREKLLASHINGCLQGAGTGGPRFILSIVPAPCICMCF
jgi:hypothetical protein